MDEDLNDNAYWPARQTLTNTDYTVGDALRISAQRWPDQVALVDGDRGPRQWTFTELLADSEDVARALLGRFAVRDRLAIWAGNSPEWILVQFGAALAGMTLVTVNPAYRDAELHYVLRQSRAAGIIVQPRLRDRDLFAAAKRAAQTLPELREVISIGDWDTLVAAGRAGDVLVPLPEVTGSDPAQIQYTSGTTGFPKGALLAHRGLVVNGRVYAETIGATSADVWVNPMPLFHTAGCRLVTLGALQTGGCQVLPSAFDAEVVLDLFAEHGGTLFLSVPTMLIRMLDIQRDSPRDLSTWRLATLGGAPVPVELVRRAQGDLSLDVGIGFGQTESSPYITHTLPSDPHPAWFETVGKPLPYVEVKISNQDGSAAAIGVEGEICTRGVCVMTEYFQDPEATRAAIDSDGWLHTGDVGSMDAHGYIRVHGRYKDLIIRGGENIYPREVEDMLFTHPGVRNVSVVGLPDNEWGEVVAAFVEVHGAVSEAELRQHLKGTLASYKIPHVWQFVDEFPQTASGKIQKFVLREQYLASLGTLPTGRTTSSNDPTKHQES